jgi:hypothetical protein
MRGILDFDPLSGKRVIAESSSPFGKPGHTDAIKITARKTPALQA